MTQVNNQRDGRPASARETSVAEDTRHIYRPTAARRALDLLTRFWLVIPLIAMIVYFTAQNPSAFLDSINLQSILETAAPLLIMGVAMTYVIGSAGIDLSVGSIVVFSSVIAEKWNEAHGGTGAGVGVVIVGIVLGLVSGGAWGFVNGILIGRLRIPALIATLGTLGAALGVAELITSGNDLTSVPSALRNSLGFERPLGIPISMYIAVVITLIGGFFLFKTRFGLRTLAIGSDAEVAKRKGIKVSRHLVRVYTLAGILYGVVGVLNLALYSTTGLSTQSSDNLNAIAAVIIGGTSLFGGVATMFGTVLGTFIPSVLSDGLVIIGVTSFWQDVVVGAVLCVAVYLDQWQRRRSARE